MELEERTQDIYNADILDDILAKTVITRTFEEITGKEIRRIQQVPVTFAPEERAVYQQVMKEFEKVWRNYFASTGNARKDAGLKLMQQITLLLRVSAAPNTLTEYEGGTPVKIRKAVEMAAQWNDQIVAIGVRHKNVLDAYVAAFQEYLPGSSLVCGYRQYHLLRQTPRPAPDTEGEWKWHFALYPAEPAFQRQL